MTVCPQLPIPIKEMYVRLRSRGRDAVVWKALFAIVLMAANAGFSAAQEAKQDPVREAEKSPVSAQDFSTFEGQNVTAVEVAGRPGFSTAAFSSLLVQHAGEPFSVEQINRTVAALKAA